MEVAPRLKSSEKKPEVQKIKFVPEKVAVPDVEIKVDTKEVKEELKVDEPQDPGSFFGNNIVLIIIFATIIVILILVIIWLVSRNDNYLAWLKGAVPCMANLRKPQPKPVEQPVKSANCEMADTDELAMYANLPDVKSAGKTLPVIKEYYDESDESDKGDKSDKIVKDEPDEIDAELANELDKQLSITRDDNVAPSAISEAIDAEVAKMDDSQTKEIEQISVKTGNIAKTFTSTADIVEEGFDLDAVLQCCRGERTKYRNYIWRFKK